MADSCNFAALGRSVRRKIVSRFWAFARSHDMPEARVQTRDEILMYGSTEQLRSALKALLRGPPKGREGTDPAGVPVVTSAAAGRACRPGTLA
jgi:hypothetical protein